MQCLNATQLLASTDDVDALLVALVTSTLAAPSHCADLDGVSDWWGALHEVLEEETHLNASDTTALACECRREADRDPRVLRCRRFLTGGCPAFL